MTSRYEYDLEYSLPGGPREAYECWLEEATLTWGADERVMGFTHQVNDTGFEPCERFVFEFDSLREWAAFVEDDAHQYNVDRLRELVTDLRATLWNPRRVGIEGIATPDTSAATEQWDIPG